MSIKLFNEELTEKMMHEFAMQNLNQVARAIFESCSDETKTELFKENLAAGQGFYQGAKWQSSLDEAKYNLLNEEIKKWNAILVGGPQSLKDMINAYEENRFAMNRAYEKLRLENENLKSQLVANQDK